MKKNSLFDRIFSFLIKVRFTSKIYKGTDIAVILSEKRACVYNVLCLIEDNVVLVQNRTTFEFLLISPITRKICRLQYSIQDAFGIVL